MKPTMNDNDDASRPTFSDDSLVCNTSQFWTGKTVSVIVDRAAGLIHFQNCYRPRWSMAIWPQSWFSCPLTDLRYARHFCHKGNCALNISITTGVAVISAGASNYGVLRETLATLLPPVHGLIRDGDDVAGMAGLGAFGGLVAGFFLALRLPPSASGAIFGFVILGGMIVGVVLAVLLANWVLKRKFRK